MLVATVAVAVLNMKRKRRTGAFIKLVKGIAKAVCVTRIVAPAEIFIVYGGNECGDGGGFYGVAPKQIFGEDCDTVFFLPFLLSEGKELYLLR